MESQDRKEGVILYDRLYCLGGAEKVTLDFARALPGSDICVASINREIFEEESLNMKGIISLKINSSSDTIRNIGSIYAFRNNTKFIENYKWVIYSGNLAPLSVCNHNNGFNMLYCHNIPRYLYDLHEYYLSKKTFKYFEMLKMALFKKLYENAFMSMNKVIANSENVKARIIKYLGKNVEVIYPPCDIDTYEWLGQHDYYVSTARLEEYKRVKYVIEAFKRMPDKKLIVLSGGSMYKEIVRLASDYSNIKLLGWVTERKKREIIGKCIATIYVPMDEDFGMSPVESMASGKPVIGVNSGGLIETIDENKTGFLISETITIEKIMAAVNKLSADVAMSMRYTCVSKAKHYSYAIFKSKINTIIESI